MATQFVPKNWGQKVFKDFPPGWVCVFLQVICNGTMVQWCHIQGTVFHMVFELEITWNYYSYNPHTCRGSMSFTAGTMKNTPIHVVPKYTCALNGIQYLYVSRIVCSHTLGIQPPSENGNGTKIPWGCDYTPQSSSDKVIGSIGIQKQNRFWKKAIPVNIFDIEGYLCVKFFLGDLSGIYIHMEHPKMFSRTYCQSLDGL